MRTRDGRHAFDAYQCVPEASETEGENRMVGNEGMYGPSGTDLRSPDPWQAASRLHRFDEAASASPPPAGRQWLGHTYFNYLAGPGSQIYICIFRNGSYSWVPLADATSA